MNAKVVWSHGLSFKGSAETGFEVPLGSEPAVGGDNDGFRPMEMVAIGLAACTAMDVISILSKKKQEVTAFEVKIHADRADQHPKVFTHATIEYIVTGHAIDRTAVERSVELSETKYCPAQAMLSKAFPIDHTITIHES